MKFTTIIINCYGVSEELHIFLNWKIWYSIIMRKTARYSYVFPICSLSWPVETWPIHAMTGWKWFRWDVSKIECEGWAPRQCCKPDGLYACPTQQHP